MEGPDDGAKCNIFRFTGDTGLQGVLDAPEGRAALQGDVSRSDGRGLVKFLKEQRAESCSLKGAAPSCTRKYRGKPRGSCWSELNMNQQCALVASYILGCVRRSAVSRLRAVTLAFSSALVRLHLKCLCPISGSSV